MIGRVSVDICNVEHGGWDVSDEWSISSMALFMVLNSAHVVSRSQ
jgi:hypothetical protein